MSVVRAAEGAPAGSRGRASLAPVFLALVAISISLVLAVLDRATVTSRADLARVRFGLPLGWLTQDQSSLDPPLPTGLRFASPWDHSVSVALLPLAIDVAAVYALLLAGLFVVRVVRRAGT